MKNEKPGGTGLVDVLAGTIGSQPQSTKNDIKPHRKLHSILTALLSGSLNTFEAARIRDTCLHTTASVLRGKGYNVVGQWEEVPTRFGKPCRVKRYCIPRPDTSVGGA